MKKTFLIACLLAAPLALHAQSGARPQILVLGTYHMANPGRDIHNMHVDDVRSPKRQQEIAQLVDVLKRFHPTRIAVESGVGSKRVGQQYSDYLAGKYTLSNNEVDQIGFRLGKELGLKTIDPVDEEGDFPYERALNWAKANGRAAALDSAQARVGARVQEENDFLEKHSVLEMLSYINSDSMVKKDVASYLDFVPFGDPFEYAGPDLLASWYQRNIRIYHNIHSLIESPNDRILVIYGAGHLGWLRQDVENDMTVQLRKLSDLAAPRSGTPALLQ